MVYIKNQQRKIKVNQRRIERYLKKALRLLTLNQAEVSIVLVNDRRMRSINRQFRGIDKTTNVISFPQYNPEEMRNILKFQPSDRFLLGDIVINLSMIQKEAVEHGLTFDEELREMMIHGLLHLIGYDHEKSSYGRRKMQKKELELLSLT
ncbi:MAG: rRNA maturation RNase YbeY [Nitrospirota bacterium]